MIMWAEGWDTCGTLGLDSGRRVRRGAARGFRAGPVHGRKR